MDEACLFRAVQYFWSPALEHGQDLSKAVWHASLQTTNSEDLTRGAWGPRSHDIVSGEEFSVLSLDVIA